jgi:hypothetical protein
VALAVVVVGVVDILMSSAEGAVKKIRQINLCLVGSLEEWLGGCLV